VSLTPKHLTHPPPISLLQRAYAAVPHSYTPPGRNHLHVPGGYGARALYREDGAEAAKQRSARSAVLPNLSNTRRTQRARSSWLPTKPPQPRRGDRRDLDPQTRPALRSPSLTTRAKTYHTARPPVQLLRSPPELLPSGHLPRSTPNPTKTPRQTPNTKNRRARQHPRARAARDVGPRPEPPRPLVRRLVEGDPRGLEADLQHPVRHPLHLQRHRHRRLGVGADQHAVAGRQGAHLPLRPVLALVGRHDGAAGAGG